MRSGAPPRHPLVTDGKVSEVDVVRYVVYYVLFFFWLLLTARIVVELVRSFARSWQPVGGGGDCLGVGLYHDRPTGPSASPGG